MGRRAIPIEPHIDRLEQAILMGATYDLAARFAGVSGKTFERWRQQAATARDGTPLARLRDRLRAAEGRAAVAWLALIERAAQAGDWRAAAWKLAARYPDAYGSRARVAVTVDIQAMAAKVAGELGLETEAVLAEATQLLRECDAAGGR